MATDTVPLPTRHGGETPARPLWLLAELTYACPLQCPYCSNPTEMARIGREIDTEAWKKVLRQARAMGAAQLGLSGGEPLVRRDLEEIVAEGRRLGYYSNLITSGIGMNRTQKGHLEGRRQVDEDLLYRNPSQPSIDGNTVDSQIEQALFTRNTLNYNASFEFLSSKFKGMKGAIRGE